MIKNSELRALLSNETIDFNDAFKMIAEGADPNTISRSGDNILHRAIDTNHFEYIKAALETGVNPNTPNGRGLSPLFCIMSQSPCHFGIAAELIRRGASRYTVISHNNNLLHLAAYSNRVETIQLALSSGIELHGLNDEDQIPLLCLLRQPKVCPESFALLLFAGAWDLKNQKSKDNKTAFILPTLAMTHGVSLTTMFRITNNELKRLARTPKFKEDVIEYIKSFNDPAFQLYLINQALKENTTLNRFFAVKRDWFKTKESCGTFAILKDLKAEITKILASRPVSTMQPSTNFFSKSVMPPSFPPGTTPSAPPPYNPDLQKPTAPPADPSHETTWSTSGYSTTSTYGG